VRRAGVHSLWPQTPFHVARQHPAGQRLRITSGSSELGVRFLCTREQLTDKTISTTAQQLFRQPARSHNSGAYCFKSSIFMHGDFSAISFGASLTFTSANKNHEPELTQCSVIFIIIFEKQKKLL